MSERPANAEQRLDQFLHRLGRSYQEAGLRDAFAHAQIEVLRHLLVMVENAAYEEGLGQQAIDRILTKVIYGGVPSLAEVQYRQQMAQAQMQLLEEHG